MRKMAKIKYVTARKSVFENQLLKVKIQNEYI